STTPQAANKAVRKTKSGKPKSGRPRAWTAAEVEEAFRRFHKVSPEPKTELQYVNPFTLLVAVVLSAQATDAGVNKATPALFAPARRRTQRQGAARSRGAGGVARRRAQDRERRAQRGVRREDHRGRHPYLPCRQPDQHGARGNTVRGRTEAREDHPGQIPDAR